MFISTVCLKIFHPNNFNHRAPFYTLALKMDGSLKDPFISQYGESISASDSARVLSIHFCVVSIFNKKNYDLITDMDILASLSH